MIHLYTVPLFEKYAQHDSIVIELGDQLVNITEYPGAPHIRERSIDYYANKAPEMLITSIDNRKDADRALNLDLSKTIAKNVKDSIRADILTDFGTIEHVKSLYHALKNSFDLVKTGGLFIHSNPKTNGYAPGHGYHYFCEEFWGEYCKASGMELVEVGEHPAEDNKETGWEIFAVIRKSKGAKFPTKKVFDEIYKKYITSE